jgi:Fe-Mn family superoxide dismutase
MFYRNSLQYDFDALEPFIDAETMKEHYHVHFKKYTDNLNKELAQLHVVTDSIYDVINNITIYPKSIRDNGGGYLNHIIYFENLSPEFNNYHVNASQTLKSLLEGIGGVEGLQYNFEKAAGKVFGSGWVWLVLDNGVLKIFTTANQDNPLMANSNVKILLGMDVWEHAYYLKHKADRAAYVKDFFKVINWNTVSERI